MNSLNRNIIYLIFTLKLILSGFFISPYFNETFVPFLDLFGSSGYDAWVNNPSGYPYPPLLTFIIFIFYKISFLFDSTYISNLIYHIPILIFDYGIFYFLLKLIPKNPKKILFYYLLSPIVFYSSYIYSQHDLIPTFFILAGAYYASKNNFLKGYLIYGIAIAIKWHTIIALPVFFIFSFRKHLTIQALIKFSLMALIPLIVTLIPFGSLSRVMSLFNIGESNLIFESYLSIKDMNIYLFPLLYSLLIVWAFRIKRYNSELFIGINAILFLLFIIIVYPNPGWFVWSLPFLIYSFAKYEKRNKELYALYSLISVVYLVFFLFLYKHPISEIASINFLDKDISFYLFNPQLTNIIFTLLVSLMFIATYLVYLSSIQNSLLFKRKFNAFLIGIAGDSGSGKSTLLASIQALLGSSSATVLEGDGEHKWERGDKHWNETTHLNPKANYLHKQLSHLINLKKGLKTHRSDYNHHTGTFDNAKEVKAKDFIVLAGLHPFYLKGARENIDFKIFINTELELRKNWKVVRDMQERGHEKNQILEQIEARIEDSKKFINPQMEFADLVINYSTKNEIKDITQKVSMNEINIEYLINTEINLDRLIYLLTKAGCKDIKHNYLEDLTMQSLSFDFEGFQFSEIKNEFDDFFDNLEIYQFEWEQNSNIINQLIILYCIQERYIGENDV